MIFNNLKDDTRYSRKTYQSCSSDQQPHEDLEQIGDEEEIEVDDDVFGMFNQRKFKSEEEKGNYIRNELLEIEDDDEELTYIPAVEIQKEKYSKKKNFLGQSQF